jgi:hypothetical protein
MPEAAPTLAYARATLAAPPGKDGPVEFVASSDKLNRYGFRLRRDGWRLDNFQANPVFLWMHNPSQPPIGRVDARHDGEALRAGVTFDGDDELARTVERKYRAGFLNAVSVGWGFVKADGTPIREWYRLTPEQIASKEVFYDLEELSGVSVPGDPRAIRKQQRRALAWLSRELLDLDADPAEPDDDLAELVKAEVGRHVDGALVDALGRLGVDLEALRAHPTATSGEPAATTEPTTDQAGDDPGQQDPAAPALQGLDPSAVQDLLAAFTLKEG